MTRTSLLVLLIACAGKAAEPPPAPAPSVPQWVDRMPDQKGKLCALGTAEPTFFREDGKTYAADAARNQLAMTLSVRVQSVMLDIQTSNSQSVDQAYVMQAQSFATDAVVAGWQVGSYWYDD